MVIGNTTWRRLVNWLGLFGRYFPDGLRVEPKTEGSRYASSLGVQLKRTCGNNARDVGGGMEIELKLGRPTCESSSKVLRASEHTWLPLEGCVR